MRLDYNIFVTPCELAKFWNKKTFEKRKIMLDISADFVYYMRVGSKPTAHGEVA